MDKANPLRIKERIEGNTIYLDGSKPFPKIVVIQRITENRIVDEIARKMVRSVSNKLMLNKIDD
jgi:hypothetical protein